MIRRIVHLHIADEHVDDFLELFAGSREAILSMNGCLELRLLQQTDDPGKFTTFSSWHSAADLEAYRSSDLFRSTWTRTKAMFAGKPWAASFDELYRGGLERSS